jgi:hypothetical protein
MVHHNGKPATNPLDKIPALPGVLIVDSFYLPESVLVIYGTLVTLTYATAGFLDSLFPSNKIKAAVGCVMTPCRSVDEGYVTEKFSLSSG